MSVILAVIRRDVARAFGGGAMLPLVFFLLVATLYPFAVGPDTARLAQTGGGVIWIAALLAALLPVDRLIAPDADNGILDQLKIRGVSDEAVIAAKMVAHWLSFGPPLMLAAVPAAALLKLSANTLLSVEISLLLGTPGLAALGILVAALTTGLRNAGALAGLLLMPLAIPILIFGASATSQTAASGQGATLSLLAAASLFVIAVTPFAAGSALRGLRL
jgi:heme exporter protein B